MRRRRPKQAKHSAYHHRRNPGAPAKRRQQIEENRQRRRTETWRLRRSQPHVREHNIEAKAASTQPPTLSIQISTHINARWRKSSTKCKRAEAVQKQKSGATKQTFDPKAISLFFIWVLISTINLCTYTHHNGHPKICYLTLSSPRSHLSTGTLKTYAIRNPYPSKSYLTTGYSTQHHTIFHPLPYSPTSLNHTLLTHFNTKCHLPTIYLTHIQLSPSTKYSLLPTTTSSTPTCAPATSTPHTTTPTTHSS